MSDVARVPVDLSGVQETLLIPLAARVGEARRTDSGYSDPGALAIADRLDTDIVSRFAGEWTNMAAVVGRTKILDREVATWLASHRDGPEPPRVLNLACGLCTRFQRVDDGRVRWLDLDLPPVILLKRRLIQPTDRYDLLASDALSPEWLPVADSLGSGPVLVVIEGLSMYLSRDQVTDLLELLRDHFGSCTVLIEVISPLILGTIGRISPSVRSTGAVFDFGVRDASELEALTRGVTVTGQWLHTEVHPEQWRWLRFLRPIRAVHAAMKVVRLELERR